MTAETGFDKALGAHGLWPLLRGGAETLQINVGKLCNQACHHCHVEAGPGRKEIMTERTATRIIDLLTESRLVRTVDLTGGAPELNPNFRFLVESAAALQRGVSVRCNLTILLVPGMEWLPEFYRDYAVELICSLPCYSAANVEQQRGAGVFEKSIAALRILNKLGYGWGKLRLNLVYNPVGAFLPPPQDELQETYRAQLLALGIRFDRLFTITNMPIKRFAQQLHQWGKEAEYMSLLINHFNPIAVDNLMCRNLLSVGFGGNLYDCDFNQMLEMPMMTDGKALTLWHIENFDSLAARPIATGMHCFGCTAGAGSSCGGALT